MVYTYHSFLIHSSASGLLGSSLIAHGAVRNSLYPRNRASAGTGILHHESG